VFKARIRRPHTPRSWPGKRRGLVTGVGAFGTHDVLTRTGRRWPIRTKKRAPVDTLLFPFAGKLRERGRFALAKHRRGVKKNGFRRHSGFRALGSHARRWREMSGRIGRVEADAETHGGAVYFVCVHAPITAVMARRRRATSFFSSAARSSRLSPGERAKKLAGLDTDGIRTSRPRQNAARGRAPGAEGLSDDASFDFGCGRRAFEGPATHGSGCGASVRGFRDSRGLARSWAQRAILRRPARPFVCIGGLSARPTHDQYAQRQRVDFQPRGAHVVGLADPSRNSPNGHSWPGTS